MTDDLLTTCPCCEEQGNKTERVGTYKCTDGPCRVHFYQRARPQDVIA